MNVVAVSLAVVTGLTVTWLVREADDARRRWGDTRTVTVAVHELGPGDVVAAGDVTSREHPAALVPDGALDEPGVGRTVRSPVSRGEVLVEQRFGPSDATGPAAMLAPGTRGVAIPRSGLDVPVSVGDRVDLVATFDGAGPSAPTSVVAEGVLVVAAGEDGATVAVGTERVEPVTYAVVHGTVTLALTP